VLTLGVHKEIRLTVPMLTYLNRRLQVSYSCLLKRINDLVTGGQVGVTNCALIAAPAVSAKYKTHYAPRVIVSCTPRRWFIPPNKRLASLGLAALLNLWDTAPAFKTGTAESEITMWSRETWRKTTTTQHFEYIFFVPRPTVRVMLSAFDCS